MRTPHLLLCAAVTTTAMGCAQPRLAPPSAVQAAQELKVEGYKAGTYTFRDKDLKIGSYEVTNIDRDWDKRSSTGAGPWSREASKKAYRYDVKAQGRTVHGECTELGVEHSIGGFGKGKLTLTCECAEDGEQRAKVELVNGAGTATVAGIPYELSELHTSEEGRQISQALGYQFSAAQSTGAVDVSGTGRAWLPPSASEEQSLGLVCSYAGFLLYRPSQR